MSLTMTPPTSSSPKPRQALARSFVKTPVWRPKKLSLTCRMASSKLRKGKTTTTGAKASLEQTWALTGTFSRTVGGKNVPFARPPARTRPPRATASSTQRWVRSAAASSTIGPMSVPGSRGSPTRSAATPAADLEDDPLLARPLLHPPADRGAAGEGEDLEAVVGDHQVAELPAHRQDADPALRDAGRVDDLGDRQHRQGVLRGRLEDDRAARGDRWRGLVSREVEGEGERADG